MQLRLDRKRSLSDDVPPSTKKCEKCLIDIMASNHNGRFVYLKVLRGRSIKGGRYYCAKCAINVKWFNIKSQDFDLFCMEVLA